MYNNKTNDSCKCQNIVGLLLEYKVNQTEFFFSLFNMLWV